MAQLLLSKTFLFLVLAVVVTVFPIAFVGFHDSPDLKQHIQFASTFRHTIRSGEFFPSWSSEENLGYGSVGLRFYPPLFHVLLGLTRNLTGKWDLAMAVVVMLFTIVRLIGVYFWAQEFIGPRDSLFAASISVLMPFHLSQIYTSALYTQFCAASVLPLAFYFVTRICRGRGAANVAGLAASFALVILINLPTAVIGAMSLAVYAAAFIKRTSVVLLTAKLSAAALLALGATAFYWIRMYPELPFFRNTENWVDKTFDFREHFLLTVPSNLVGGIWFNNYLLISTCLLAVCGLVGIWFQRRSGQESRIRPIVVVLGFSVFMMTLLSYPLWLYFPYLAEVQFPWRWQLIASLATPVIFAAGINGYFVALRSGYGVRDPKCWLGLLTIISVTLVFQQLAVKFNKHLIPAAEFNSWSEVQTTKLGFEYFWTKEARKDVFVTGKQVSGDRVVRINEWRSAERIFEIAEGEPSELRVATLYYPNWRATVNDITVTVRSDENGAIIVPVGRDPAIVRLWFEETHMSDSAKDFSVVVWIGLLVTLVLKTPLVNVFNRIRQRSTKN